MIIRIKTIKPGQDADVRNLCPPFSLHNIDIAFEVVCAVMAHTQASTFRMLCSSGVYGDTVDYPERLNKLISGYWLVTGDTMRRVNMSGDLTAAIDFVLDLERLDLASIQLLVGTVEGMFADDESSLGFPWELVLTGKNHTVTIGFNEAKSKDQLPVTIVTHTKDYVVCEECPQIELSKIAV